jgi:hypothetical protein
VLARAAPRCRIYHKHKFLMNVLADTCAAYEM